MTQKETVLLTGISGFLGSHTAIQLLERGYQVIGTLRDMRRAGEIQAIITRDNATLDRLRLAEADLLNDTVWFDLMKGVDYVLHLASPFPSVLPKHEDELILPARNGSLNVLRAASQNGVKRVVLTSSIGAIAYGREKSQRSGTYSERDWTNIHNRKDTTPYYRSKTIAEKAAWEYISSDTSGLELSTICPSAILGPVLERDAGTSANVVIGLMDGSAPAVPRIGYDVVDVRSVADLHIRVMETNAAAGERFIASTDYLTFKEIADILRAAFPDRKIPASVLPTALTKLLSPIFPTLKPIMVDLDVARRYDNTKARTLLNWEPIPAEEAVLACARSLIALNIL